MEKRSFILRDEAIRDRMLTAGFDLPVDPKHPVEVIFREYKKNRSLEANAYYWSQIVTPLAEHCGYTPEQMHEVLLGQIYGTSQRTFRGRKVEVPNRRTSGMLAKEFSDHITHATIIATEQGVRINTAERSDDSHN